MIIRNHDGGFTLLEALVTVVIVSIGLLGLLALQTASLVNTQLSAARTQATLGADNIADRMRANRTGVADNAYDGFDHPAENTSPGKSCRDGKICNSSEMAAFDAYEWDRSLGPPRLPNGEGALKCIEKDGSACLRYRIVIRWTERDHVDAADDHALQTFETVVQP